MDGALLLDRDRLRWKQAIAVSKYARPVSTGRGADTRGETGLVP